MPIKAFWANEEKTILQYDYVDTWTLDEYYAVTNQAYDMMRTVPWKVDVILNFLENKYSPPNSLFHMRNGWARRPQNLYFNVMVQKNQFVEALTNLFVSLTKELKGRLVCVKTMDDAHKLIAAHQQKRAAANPAPVPVAATATAEAAVASAPPTAKTETAPPANPEPASTDDTPAAEQP